MNPEIQDHPIILFGCLLVAGYLTWGLMLGLREARRALRGNDLPGIPSSRQDRLGVACVVVLLVMLFWPGLGLTILPDSPDDDKWD